MALFSSGWITFGSANFCSCSKSIQRQTLACSTSTVPMFQCWKSTRAIENQVIFNIFCIFCIFLFIVPPQPGSLSVNLQLSTNAVNKHKFCMWFQSPPYWDAFLLFQWVLQGQYPSPCVEKRLTFPELSAINQQTVVMVVGGGTWTAGPWDGGPSSSSNKEWKPCERPFSSRICIICTICNVQYVEYAQYASRKYAEYAEKYAL